MKKLAIVTTHPIQYYAPVFRLLHQRENISVKIFYTWGEASLKKFDPGFGKQIIWDVPLLDGYEYEWATNTSQAPGSHHFKGIVTPDLIEQIENYQPDAVLIFGWAYQSHLKVMRYFKGKLPVYFRGDSTLLDQQSGFKALFRSITLRWVYRHIDHAFYVGRANRDYFLRYGLKAHQLNFAPHAIDNERFANSRKEEVAEFRKKLGIAEDQQLILFVGKLEDKKSPDLLLRAFTGIDNADKHLLFVGNGNLEPSLKEQAADNNKVHFVDLVNQSDIPVVYQACDLFCLPSKGPAETWGLAVNEAMACGKAVLVSDKCGCANDLVTDKHNGAIVKAGNVDDLAEKLAELTRSKDTLKNYGRHSAVKIAGWNFAAIAQAIEDKLLNEKSRPN
ncbi:glycosyltransferase family 4 protein [Mucilaginibacter myungsuensis]|uniref:Glycosyltransferase family 4 protein n=1 Tax=Mucilaginibacter myungsuensis TaxID=649104 RepID=A0A929KUU3_9SPHI|nr:glycosyltransferase family 4 protein [Mucilaginibacter myungsuensis]MBE9660838.1 glycosyltransferase family 4 protein [Mucilaginibacter myungsuensis]MDN3600885.1 glycosyltransferase family 4 protein [Mucilaginibacter myungsuensis]